MRRRLRTKICCHSSVAWVAGVPCQLVLHELLVFFVGLLYELLVFFFLDCSRMVFISVFSSFNIGILLLQLYKEAGALHC